MVDSVYGPTRRFCNTLAKRINVDTTFYDPAIGASIAELIQDNTKVVYAEAPGSQTFVMQDIPAIAEAAHARGCTVLMDNTWASPLYCKPFTLGVDVSIQAGTKYIVGHSDVMIGTITTTEEHWRRVRQSVADQAAPSGPDDVYLALRGLRTLAVRLGRHQETALTLAQWLRDRPEVSRVIHPALEGDAGHDLWKRDFTGASGLFGFVMESCTPEQLSAYMNGLEHFGMGASWGGYESLMIPNVMANVRTATKWSAAGPSLRLHIGLEDTDDLIEDLEKGFARLKK